MSAPLPLMPDEAVAAIVAAVGPPPAEGKYVAQRLGESVLNAVTTQDAQDRGFPHVWAGGGWLVGPDGKVFTLSSNPGIHDWELATRLLQRIYSDGLATVVEPQSFIERLRRMTEERDNMERELIRDVKGGALRSKSRSLP